MAYASGKYAIAECPRCHGLYPHARLVQDPNLRLRVCRDCLDAPDFAPFRVPSDSSAPRWVQPPSSEGAPAPYTLPFDPYDITR